jgi:hypothetical protein
MYIYIYTMNIFSNLSDVKILGIIHRPVFYLKHYVTDNNVSGE